MSEGGLSNGRASFRSSKGIKSLCERLVPLLTSLKRFESSFGKVGVAGSSDAARQLLAVRESTAMHLVVDSLISPVSQDSIKVSEEAIAQRPVAIGTLAAYLILGSELSSTRHAHTVLSANLASILNGGMIPVTRTAKEELTALLTELTSIHLESSSSESNTFSHLRELYIKATESKADIDLVEAQLDEGVRSLISDAFGDETTTLEPEILDAEVKSLTDAAGVISSKGNQETSDKRKAEDAAVLSLVANSLQRIHAGAEEEDDDEGAEIEDDEEEDDDDDDMFYMPMMPVMADAANFRELAQPLSSTEAKPFMITLEPEEGDAGEVTRYSNPRASRDVQDHPGGAGGEVAANDESLPGLTEADFIPMSPTAEDRDEGGAELVDDDEAGPEREEVRAQGVDEVTEALAATDLTATAVHEGTETAPLAATTTATAAIPAETAAVSADAIAKTSVMDGVEKEFKDAANAAAPADPAAAAAAAAFATALAAPSSQAAGASSGKPDEKLNNFVNFLQGDNPGACMFHAQMRLSLEGCKKLADFVAGSNRVRALSLSHNFIGDDGLLVLCQGLKLNSSVTSLELPNNNIGNRGVKDLCDAVKKNANLTQLQLSNNKISDEGAVSLAEFIKNSNSIKKLGLSHNSVGKTGCQALIAAIKGNQSLNQLQILPGTPVEEKDAKALAKALLRKKKFSIGSFLGL